MCRPIPLLFTFAALALAGCGSSGGDADEAPNPELLRPLSGGRGTNQLMMGIHAYSRPDSQLPAETKIAFFSGNSFFHQSWVEAPASAAGSDGLGPLYNARSCSTCHPRDGRGAPGETGQTPHQGLLLRLSVPGESPHGAPTPSPTYGGQIQDFALRGLDAEARVRISYAERAGAFADGTPYSLGAPTYHLDDLAYGALEEGYMLSPRVGLSVFGLGLLEAIPEDDIVALADPDDRDGDGISGRVQRVWDIEAQAVRMGRFGWKAGQPSIRQQVAGAFFGDMGLSSELFPEQGCTEAQTECAEAPTGIDKEGYEIRPLVLSRVVTYCATLAVPVRRNLGSPEVIRGAKVFEQLNCGGCHTATHRTGPAEIDALSDQVIHPYTDLLLHDMGEGLADGRPDFEASGREWRTPPLWGLGLMREVNGHERLLHDGRADGPLEAILWHDGEAQASREAFEALGRDDRDALIAFLRSL